MAALPPSLLPLTSLSVRNREREEEMKNTLKAMRSKEGIVQRFAKEALAMHRQIAAEREERAQRYYHRLPLGNTPCQTPDWLWQQITGKSAPLRFFCDPFLEEVGFREALYQINGHPLLEKRQELYENAISFARAHPHVALGNPLPLQQRESLEKPIIWYEKRCWQGEWLFFPAFYFSKQQRAEWSRMPCEAGVVHCKEFQLKGKSFYNNGIVIVENKAEIDVDYWTNERRTVKVEQLVERVKPFRKSNRVVTSDELQPGGVVELGEGKLFIRGQGVNRGGILEFTKEGRIEAGSFRNESIAFDSVVHLDPGRVAPWKSCDKYSIRTDFLPATIQSFGTLTFNIETTLENIGSTICSLDNLTILAHSFTQCVQFSHYQSHIKRGMHQDEDIYSIVMQECEIATLAKLYCRTGRGGLLVQGKMTAVGEAKLISDGPINFQSVTCEVENRMSKKQQGIASETRSKTHWNSCRTSQPQLNFYDNLTIETLEDLTMEAVKMQAYKNVNIKASSVYVKAHTVNHHQITKGVTLGLSFFCSKIIEAMDRGESPTDSVLDLVQESTTLSTLMSFARSKGKPDLIKNSVILAYNGYKQIKNAVASKIRDILGLPNKGKLFNLEGLKQAITRISIEVTHFSSENRWTESLLTEMLVGGTLTIEAPYQEFQAFQLHVCEDFKQRGSKIVFKPAVNTFSHREQSASVGVGVDLTSGNVVDVYASLCKGKSNQTECINNTLSIGQKWDVQCENQFHAAGLKASADRICMTADQIHLGTPQNTFQQHSGFFAFGTSLLNVGFGESKQKMLHSANPTELIARTGGFLASRYCHLQAATLCNMDTDVEHFTHQSNIDYESGRSYQANVSIKQMAEFFGGREPVQPLPSQDEPPKDKVDKVFDGITLCGGYTEKKFFQQGDCKSTVVGGNHSNLPDQINRSMAMRQEMGKRKESGFHVPLVLVHCHQLMNEIQLINHGMQLEKLNKNLKPLREKALKEIKDSYKELQNMYQEFLEIKGFKRSLGYLNNNAENILNNVKNVMNNAENILTIMDKYFDVNSPGDMLLEDLCHLVGQNRFNKTEMLSALVYEFYHSHSPEALQFRSFIKNVDQFFEDTDLSDFFESELNPSKLLPLQEIVRQFSNEG